MEPTWELPETQQQMVDGMVHVWRLDLVGGTMSRSEVEALLEGAYAVLSDEERARAARTRAGAPREEFVAGRGCLRRLLAAQIGQTPEQLALETSANGKPSLRQAEGLAFNVTHSHGMVLIALSRAGAVGVDVEAVSESVEVMELAAAALHPADVARVAATHSTGRVEEFYRCWTRREAVAKADGRGLTAGADEWEVGGVSGWSGGYFVQDLRVGGTHRAALATQELPLEVRRLSLQMFSPLSSQEKGGNRAYVTSR